MAWLRVACGVALLGLWAGTAKAAGREVVGGAGLYAVGDRELEPGMTLYVFRPEGAKVREVGRLRVLRVQAGEVALELLSGSPAMQSGDQLEVEASSPGEWLPYRLPAPPVATAPR